MCDILTQILKHCELLQILAKSTIIIASNISSTYLKYKIWDDLKRLLERVFVVFNSFLTKTITGD